MNKDIKEWAKKCLLCIKLAGGDIIPRPMGYQLRATQPMEVVSIDYMDMPRSAKKWGFKAILASRRRPTYPNMHYGAYEG